MNLYGLIVIFIGAFNIYDAVFNDFKFNPCVCKDKDTFFLKWIHSIFGFAFIVIGFVVFISD